MLPPGDRDQPAKARRPRWVPTPGRRGGLQGDTGRRDFGVWLFNDRPTYGILKLVEQFPRVSAAGRERLSPIRSYEEID